MPLALALLNAVVPPGRRGWAMGIFGGVTGLATLVGPVLGGAITQGIAWPWIFWINVPIGLLAIPLVLLRVQESYGPRAGLDIPGWPWAPAPRSDWSGAWCAATQPAGAAPKSPGRLGPGRCC
jgi:MFS family permease